MSKPMTENHRLQLEQAANGCIGGLLEEWPNLDAALRHQGIKLPPETGCMALTSISKLILKNMVHEVGCAHSMIEGKAYGDYMECLDCGKRRYHGGIGWSEPDPRKASA